MKRFLMSLMTLLACSISCFTCAYAEVFTIPDSRIVDVTGDEMSVYVRTEQGEIHCFTSGESDAVLLTDGYTSNEFGGLFIYNKSLYTVKLENHQFTLVGSQHSDDSLNGIVIPAFEERTGATDIWTPYCMTGTEYGIFWLMNIDYSDEALLCRYNVETKEFSCRPISSLHAYCVQDDNTLLIVQRGMENRILSTYYWTDDSLAQLALLPQGANGFTLASDGLIFNVNSEVMKWTSDGKIEKIMHMPISCDSRVNSVLLQDDLLTAASFSQLAVRSHKHADTEKSALLVLNDNASTPGYNEFQQKNPDIEVQFSYLEEYPDTIELAQKILTGELKYDVFKISSTDFDLETLAAKGYLQDLIDNLSLLESVMQMEPKVIEAAMYDDCLYAIPCSIVGNYVEYNAENFAKAGIDVNIAPHDYQSFYDFILSWDGNSSGNIVDEFCLFSIEHNNVFPYFLKELLKANIAFYASMKSNVSFNTDQFRLLLEKCKNAAACVESEDVVGYSLFELGASRIISSQLLTLSLVPGDKPVVPVVMEFYVINPMSTNKLKAQEYIQECVAAYTPEQKLQLYPEYTEPIISQSYMDYMSQWEAEKEALENRLARTSDETERRFAQDLLDTHIMNKEQMAPEKYEITAEDIAFYKKSIAPYMFIPNSIMMNLTVNDQFAFETAITKYLNGNTTDEKFISEAEAVCSMIEMENR